MSKDYFIDCVISSLIVIIMMLWLARLINQLRWLFLTTGAALSTLAIAFWLFLMSL
jgi:hypothetical protein